MECFFSLRHTRLLFQCVSFGAILLWIVLAPYTYLNDRDLNRVENGGRSDGSSRHLLALSGGDVESKCDELALEKESGELVNLNDDQCSTIHQLASNYTFCQFIGCVDACQSEGGLLNYLSFIYCLMPFRLVPLAMIILFLWLIFLFIFLGATAEEYFCPALTVISAILRLSQNVAGVTLLALGNGAPDIFSAFAAVNQDDDNKASLAVGALFGAGIFVTTIVVGAVTVTKPFTLTQRPFLRDIIFYLFAVFWTFYLLWTNVMNIYHAVGLVFLYIVYVAVVILGRIIFQRWKKWRKKRTPGTGDMPRPPKQEDGKEMDHSNTSRTGGLGTLGSLLPGVGITGSYTHTDVKEKEERTEEEEDSSSEPRFRISSVGSSEYSTSGVVSKPVIRIQDEPEGEGEGSPLFPRMNTEERRRQKELAGASMPPLLNPAEGKGDSPLYQRRGASVEPHAKTYGAISVNIQGESGSRSPSPSREPKKLRKTISGALDVSEGVGAVFGIPHVPELWDEVARPHSRSRSGSYRPRSRSRSRSALLEEAANDDDRTPLLKPPINVPRRREESEEEESGSSGSEGEDEMAPVINLQTRKRYHPIVKFLAALWPFGAAFKELGFFGKLYEIVKSPAGLLLTLTVPVIDTNEELHNWNKWLNVLHCVTAPVFIILVTKQGLINIGGVFPVWTLVLIIATFVAILVACTSHHDRPPIYHCIFAWVGFAVAVVWIYSIANEIVNLLQAFGVVIKLSDGILGLTLLAWGNSIGDAVSNVTMAKQGFPRMAIGACFGGPLLNMLLGIGIASVVKSIRRKAQGLQFPLIFTQVELFAALFLMASLLCTLIVVLILKFRLRRPYGIFLVAVYVVFLTVAILAEAKVFQIEIPGVITVE